MVSVAHLDSRLQAQLSEVHGLLVDEPLQRQHPCTKPMQPSLHVCMRYVTLQNVWATQRVGSTLDWELERRPFLPIGTPLLARARHSVQGCPAPLSRRPVRGLARSVVLVSWLPAARGELVRTSLDMLQTTSSMPSADAPRIGRHMGVQMAASLVRICTSLRLMRVGIPPVARAGRPPGCGPLPGIRCERSAIWRLFRGGWGCPKCGRAPPRGVVSFGADPGVVAVL